MFEFFMGPMVQIFFEFLKERLEPKDYVLHGAITVCPFGRRMSNLVLEEGHGSFIHGGEQLTVSDCVSMVNILDFGGCRNPENPATIEVAKEVSIRANLTLEEQETWFDSFLSWVNPFEKKDNNISPDVSVIELCMAPCVPELVGEWSDGKESVELDGSHPLLSNSTICCQWGAEIKIQYAGQPDQR